MARGLLTFSQKAASNLTVSSGVPPLACRVPLASHCLHYPRSDTPIRLHSGCADPKPTVHAPHYRDLFARRMAKAGLKPQHRIAIGVSGGPDSTALCLLAAGWKVDAFNSVADDSSGNIEGLLAIIVDHGLRVESKEESDLVCRRISDMGIRCEVSKCVWPDGKPKPGHLQEAARDRRYQMFQEICIKHQIGVLLTAHHSDDQAELFFIRLSRNSGVLGLAGMAFSSQLFSTCSESYYGALNDHGILLVRPLLEFSKKDMYKICLEANQEWVEDPSNQSPLFARNRIRMSLRTFPSSFSDELYNVISACRAKRSYVDRICRILISQAVTVMDEGYAIIDLQALKPSKIEDICLSKFICLVLQFISQRLKPVRGSASKLLMDYIRAFPHKNSLTAAGCYLCAAPGSKGSKLLVCCSVNSPPPSKMKVLVKQHPLETEMDRITSEIEQIIDDSKLHSDDSASAGSGVHFFDGASYESVLAAARRLNIISESTLRNISLLRSEEIMRFQSKTDNCVVKNEVGCGNGSSSSSDPLPPNKCGYFMSRFVVTWKYGGELKDGPCGSCVAGHGMVPEVRHMVDADWLYLASLSKCRGLDVAEREHPCWEYVRQSAQSALLLLKPIPAAARRALPVLVDSQGIVLSVPNVHFRHCPCLEVSAQFKPRAPLGGGHSSFI